MQRLQQRIIRQTAQSVVQQGLLLTAAHTGSLYVKKQDGKFERVFYSEATLKDVVARKNGFIAGAFTRSEITVLSARDVYPLHPEFKRIGIQSFILIPIHHNGKTSAVLALQSKRKKHFSLFPRQFLQNYSQSLYKEVDLMFTYTQLQKLYRQQLVHNFFISHEIKNPLAAINLYKQQIQQALGDNKLPNKKLLISLNQEIERLTQFVKELFPNQQPQKTRFTYAMNRIDLVELLKRCILGSQFLYPHHFFVFRYQQQHAFFFGDAHKLMQAISNVINNAAKFSPQFSEIVIQILVEEKAYRIIVEDHGKGIPRKALPFVFRRFYQNNQSQKNEGKGLGLYISNTIIRAHKGSIAIDSVFHKGTRVVMTLPITKI